MKLFLFLLCFTPLIMFGQQSYVSIAGAVGLKSLDDKHSIENKSEYAYHFSMSGGYHNAKGLLFGMGASRYAAFHEEYAYYPMYFEMGYVKANNLYASFNCGLILPSQTHSTSPYLNTRIGFAENVYKDMNLMFFLTGTYFGRNVKHRNVVIHGEPFKTVGFGLAIGFIQ